VQACALDRQAGTFLAAQAGAIVSMHTCVVVTAQAGDIVNAQTRASVAAQADALATARAGDVVGAQTRAGIATQAATLVTMLAGALAIMQAAALGVARAGPVDGTRLLGTAGVACPHNDAAAYIGECAAEHQARRGRRRTDDL